MFVPPALLSAKVPFTCELPLTVTLPAAIVNVKPLFTVRFPMVTAVAGATMLELIIILSPMAGTPEGDQFAAVAQAVPVEVLIACVKPTAALSRNDKSSNVCRLFPFV